VKDPTIEGKKTLKITTYRVAKVGKMKAPFLNKIKGGAYNGTRMGGGVCGKGGGVVRVD